MKFSLKQTFFTGVLVTCPTALTLFVFYWLGMLIDSWGQAGFRFVLGKEIFEKIFPSVPFGLGLVGTLLIVFISGLLVSNWAGNWVYNLYIAIFEKIPFINHVFNLFKKVFEMVLSPDNHVFKKAVLFEFPRKGVWMIGFLSLEACDEILEKTGGESHVAVFVPTTPNPTSGVLVYVPRNEIRILDMSLEEASKLIISGGILTPEKLRKQAKTGPEPVGK
jgi:uncharacterized membrane protein